MSSDNIVLEHLRSIRGTLDNMAFDIQEIKGRVGSVEQQYAGRSNRVDRIDSRLTRIEQRLDLVEA